MEASIQVKGLYKNGIIIPENLLPFAEDERLEITVAKENGSEPSKEFTRKPGGLKTVRPFGLLQGKGSVPDNFDEIDMGLN